MTRASLIQSRVLAATLLFGASAAAEAQLANASTAATGLGGAYTARAQGYNAVFWNPANLGMPGNQGFSFTLLGVDGKAGIKPIDINRLATYSGDSVPHAVREQWMQDVERDGGERGNLGAGVTGLAFSLGPLGFQFNTKFAGETNLAPGAVEALLFGNAGRYKKADGTDSVRALDLAGSTFQSALYSTGALSYGRRFAAIPLSNFAVGVTAKYIVGHALASGIDNGTAIGTNDLSVLFPMIVPDSNSIPRDSNSVGIPKVGTGFGLDLGAAWTLPKMRVGVSVQNVVNTFKWDTTKFATRSAIGAFSSDTNYFDTDSLDRPYASAPAALREHVARLRFKPVFAAGIAFDFLPKMTISADIRQQIGDGLEPGPESMIAAGAEVRWIPFIPLRGGVQLLSGGIGLAGGVGIHLLGYEAGIAGFVRKLDGGSDSGFTLNLISIRP